MRSLYERLTEYLINDNNEKVEITYEELEKIIGRKLPDFIYNYPHRFFYNDSSRNNYFKYWNRAGYLAFPNIKKQEVTFIKGIEPLHNERNNNQPYKINVKYKIPTPCKDEVEKYLNEWETLNSSKYKYQEDSLELLYKTFPLNNKLEEILFKASTLNDFYSTNIFSILEVCQHILTLNIDAYLEEGDLSIVNKIANVTISEKDKNFYSFASKYCAHHKPNIYPIYDEYVMKVLVCFNKIDSFDNFKKEDLRDYCRFKSVLLKFMEYYKLTSYSIRDIDKYLWQLGKEYMPKNYKKKKVRNK